MTFRRKPLEVGYLVSQHPAPSQAFIQREVDGLRALGARVETFSVRPVSQDLLLDQVMQDEALRTTVIQVNRRIVASAVGALMWHRPLAFATVLNRALRTGQSHLRNRVWQGFYLAEAAYLHREMAHRGLRHLHVHFANNAADIARLAVAMGRAVDGTESGWRWSFSMHGPTEFQAVDHFDLAAKVMAADRVACISDFARSQLMRLVDPNEWPKLDIVRMSVDVDQYRPPEAPRSHDGPLRILSVGRLVPEKGAPVLVDALAELVARGVDVEATLVGAGPLEPLLRERIGQTGLHDRVTLTGAMGQDRLPDLYRRADVFCLPSFQEGLPVVLMEAMATGLPVVTTAIAGIPELVHDGESGRVVPAGRAGLVADAIAQLATDPDLRRRLGAAGRARVEAEFSLEVTARRQLDFLASVRPRSAVVAT